MKFYLNCFKFLQLIITEYSNFSLPSPDFYLFFFTARKKFKQKKNLRLQFYLTWSCFYLILKMPSKKRKYNARFPAVSADGISSANDTGKRRENIKLIFLKLCFLRTGSNQENHASWWGSWENCPSSARHHIPYTGIVRRKPINKVQQHHE